MTFPNIPNGPNGGARVLPTQFDVPPECWFTCDPLKKAGNSVAQGAALYEAARAMGHVPDIPLDQIDLQAVGICTGQRAAMVAPFQGRCAYVGACKVMHRGEGTE